MTIEEAKQYFKRYDGHYFHMGREEPWNYDEFKKFNFQDSIIEQWRQEIIDNYFEKLFNRSDNVWSAILHIIDVMPETKTNYPDNCRKLLNALNKAANLDKKQKILIIEVMAEKGCQFVCQKSDLALEMNDIMSLFMDFECYPEDSIANSIAWNDVPHKHKAAVRDYSNAFEYYKNRLAE